ncbi:hypothetical protein GUITHDRAFT_146357 [Guillardia theta CCMP2712]|uniref:Uncharacterized protein n=1 Tax=Guillardia theta (strain CCMP2712) TaxID=905079 RepID=L1IIH8_GUITC|nr:hypothetical protein GUITHDRAFT_146357 [Guillardia theta CCMP2712]EKX35620.1 hypothetical protein GUITHDRAFT_146357 [Guillardia theta CCMP2712]|eukprot:XP_005822600.1 hypothetical protein GUITHDRAFT_146357 [Guillardia theta CCMP2712]
MASKAQPTKKISSSRDPSKESKDKDTAAKTTKLLSGLSTSSSKPKPALASNKVKASKGKEGAQSKPGGSSQPNKPHKEEDATTAYISNFVAPDDPWKHHRSPYGGSLTLAENWERLKLVRSEQSFVAFSSSDLIKELHEGTGAAPCKSIHYADVIDRAIAARDQSLPLERVSLRGLDMEDFQFGQQLASRVVDLDMSSNLFTSLHRLALSWIRGLDLSGCRLHALPLLSDQTMPKLVCLNVSFNEIRALPSAEDMRALSSLRSLKMQNCMLNSLVSGQEFQLEPLVNLQILDVSFNLLSLPSELLALTKLQRLAELGIAGNEWCVHAEYEETCSAMRKRMATLKKIDATDVSKAFVGYGKAEEGERTTAADAPHAGVLVAGSGPAPPNAPGTHAGAHWTVPGPGPGSMWKLIEEPHNGPNKTYFLIAAAGSVFLEIGQSQGIMRSFQFTSSFQTTTWKLYVLILLYWMKNEQFISIRDISKFGVSLDSDVALLLV